MRRLLTPPWIVLHCFAVVLTVAFGLLGWWQLSRAQGGNAISWGYAFEWPVFAIFTLVLWIRQMRLELAKDRPEGEQPRGRPAPPPVTSPFETAILQAREAETRTPLDRPAHGSHA
ncbi:hypothetical protein [Glycomyces harbinensis]|uniref:DNA-binding transcriptional regulator of glucitol operon n=1 Tax=Glycomyces harbinensis TaxID=58114 RepID=A0A1G6SQR7_9ACTN|nr:hypothetical protein [Glycomyces harbinensis]SDD19222.1 hypothetical protein SAMN05216270_102240 [Glycomyces harbinensis]